VLALIREFHGEKVLGEWSRPIWIGTYFLYTMGMIILFIGLMSIVFSALRGSIIGILIGLILIAIAILMQRIPAKYSEREKLLLTQTKLIHVVSNTIDKVIPLNTIGDVVVSDVSVFYRGRRKLVISLTKGKIIITDKGGRTLLTFETNNVDEVAKKIKSLISRESSEEQ